MVASLGSFTVSNVPPPLVPPDTRWPAFPGAVVYGGQIELKPPHIVQLLSGHLYVNLASESLPRGELRGQIIPAYPVQLEATLNGRAAIPPNGSLRQGNASFVLTGSYLFHAIALDAGLGGAPSPCSGRRVIRPRLIRHRLLAISPGPARPIAPIPASLITSHVSRHPLRSLHFLL